MVVKQKRLGKTDLYVKPVGLGCMGLSHAYGDAVSEEEGIEFLKEAIKTDYNFFDTAKVYVGKTADGKTSTNEEMLGAANDIIVSESNQLSYNIYHYERKTGNIKIVEKENR